MQITSVADYPSPGVQHAGSAPTTAYHAGRPSSRAHQGDRDLITGNDLSMSPLTSATLDAIIDRQDRPGEHPDGKERQS